VWPPLFTRVLVCDQLTLITGDTGCGKSTQLPQFILDDAELGPRENIIVTQPRRISAIGVSDRIASERGEELGKGLVGVLVRADSQHSAATQLTFCTPAILLKKLHADPTLNEYTTIIIDEVHERDKYTEFIIITLREVLPRRPDLKVILMSATLNVDVLRNYFYPVVEVNIPGRTFPVQEFFLEEVLAMTKHVESISGGLDNLDADITLAFGKEGGLSCVMCGMRGFSTPEELGTHVACCDGGGKDFGEIEDKLRRQIKEKKSNKSQGKEEEFEEYEEYVRERSASEARAKRERSASEARAKRERSASEARAKRERSASEEGVFIANVETSEASHQPERRGVCITNVPLAPSTNPHLLLLTPAATRTRPPPRRSLRSTILTNLRKRLLVPPSGMGLLPSAATC